MISIRKLKINSKTYETSVFIVRNINYIIYKQI